MLPDDVSIDQACQEFVAMVNGSVLRALNVEGGASFQNVLFKPVEERATYCLFKDPDNPKAERIRCVEGFLPRRAVRVKWIKEVLLDPDVVVFSTREEGSALLFIRKTLPHEKFLVVVGYDRPKMFFRTAYPLNLQDKGEKTHFDNLMLGVKKYERKKK
jgi:hypothetical protein